MAAPPDSQNIEAKRLHDNKVLTAWNDILRKFIVNPTDETLSTMLSGLFLHMEPQLRDSAMEQYKQTITGIIIQELNTVYLNNDISLNKPIKQNSTLSESDKKIIKKFKKYILTFTNPEDENDITTIIKVLTHTDSEKRANAITQLKESDFFNTILYTYFNKIVDLIHITEGRKEVINKINRTAANAYLSKIGILPTMPVNTTKPIHIGSLKPHLPNVNFSSMEYMQKFTTNESIALFIQSSLLDDEIIYPELDKVIKQHAESQYKHADPKLLTDLAKLETNPHRIMHDLLSECKELRELYSIAEFLCSYIDFHHDLEKHSRPMLHSIRIEFEKLLDTFTLKNIPMYRKKDTPITRHGWYTKWIQTVDSGYTQSNQLSQRVCEDLIEGIIKELLEFAADARNVTSKGVVNWIPIDKEDTLLDTTTFHVYDSVIKYNMQAIRELRTTMHENGMDKCLADTAGGFYKYLVNNTLPPLTNMITPILGWDGSGGYKQEPSETLESNVSSAAHPLSIFGGAAKVSVTNPANTENAILTCTFSNHEIITIKGVQKLGLDRLLSTIGMQGIRSNPETEIVAINNVTFTPNIINPNIILLKTWTDFVKIRILSASSTPIGLTTNDRCCMRIAKMYGLPFVLGARNTGNGDTLNSFVDVYCYDRRVIASHQASKKRERILTFITVLYYLNGPNGLKNLIKKRFNLLSCMLLTIMNHTIDPALFFGIRQFLQKFAEYEKHAHDKCAILDEIIKTLQQRKDIMQTYKSLIEIFPTTINEWLHKIMNSNEINTYFQEVYYSLRDIKNQIKITSYNTSTKTWLDHYNAVSQHIVNATQSMDTTYHVTNIDPDTQQRYIISIFVVAFMEKRDVGKTLLFLAEILNNVITKMMDNTHFKSTDGWGTEAVDYVTADLMSNVLIPDSSSAAEWKLRLCALHHAKKNKWAAVVPNHIRDRGTKEKIFGLEDVMNMYHHILSVHNVLAPLMETILNIGCILAMMIENKVPFTFNPTEILNVSNTHSNPVPPPPKSWVELFGYTEEHTLSMIDAEPGTPGKPCRMKEKEDESNAFYGLINRIKKFMAEHKDCNLTIKNKEDLTDTVNRTRALRTRALWEEYPKTGMRRFTTMPPGAQIPKAILGMMPADLQRRPPPPLKRKDPPPQHNNNMHNNNNNEYHHPKKPNTKPKSSQNQMQNGGQRIVTNKHNRTYMFPRRFSKTYCKKRACKEMGFTEKASCRPYKNCYRLFEKKSAKNSRRVNRKTAKNSRHTSRKIAKNQ